MFPYDPHCMDEETKAQRGQGTCRGQPRRKQQACLLPEPDLAQSPITSLEHLPSTGLSAETPTFQSEPCSCRPHPAPPGATISSHIKGGRCLQERTANMASSSKIPSTVGPEIRDSVLALWGIYRLRGEMRYINRT